MKKLVTGITCLTLLTSGAALVGCDRTVEEKKTTETNRDGSTETKHEKTTVDNNGNVTTEKKTEETPPTRP